MEDKKTKEKIDTWHKAQIFAQAAIAFVGLIFTILFGIMQQKNADATIQLARSNIELSKSQLQVSLLPAFTNKHVCQRAVGLFLAKNLDEAFAVEVARALLMSDSDKSVREKARLILGMVSQSGSDEIQEKAKKGAHQYDLVSELRERGLLKNVSEAQGHIDGGNPSGIEKAIEIYHEVISQLSDSALEKLDRSLLIDAREDERLQHMEHAARKYRVLFQEYEN
jgi:hypothetical protein